MKFDIPSFIFGYVVGIILLLLMNALMGCYSAPVREFNAEDKQDGQCYATYGGIRGYCAAIEE